MITVIDSPCGAGKTQKMIDMLNKNEGGYNYIYVTPFLTEVKRIKENCTGIAFYEPKNKDKGAKFGDLKRLLKKGFNVVTTHALFRLGDKELSEIISARNYVLILDEVMDVVEVIDELSPLDIKAMLSVNLIDVAKESGEAIWLGDKLDYPCDGIFNQVKSYFTNNSVYIYNNQAMLWTFPISLFNCFKHAYICTYMFDCQIQKYYYDLYNVEYEKLSVCNGELIPYRKEIVNTNKVHILDDPILNNLFTDDIKNRKNEYYFFSKNWYKKNKTTHPEKLQTLKFALSNFFRHKVNAKSKDILWTTFKNFDDILAGKGYTKGYASSNLRGTNDYINTHYVAYTINKFLDPTISRFFESRNIEVDESAYALSEMIQFIWRSAIRNGEDITVYIPSSRMRALLKGYIDNGMMYKSDYQF